MCKHKHKREDSDSDSDSRAQTVASDFDETKQAKPRRGVDLIGGEAVLCLDDGARSDIQTLRMQAARRRDASNGRWAVGNG